MDSLEIIRQMQHDSALRAEMRAVLLGEELLSLPDLVKENSRQIAENSRQIAALVERMDRVEVQIAALVERMDRVEVQIAENSRQIASLVETVESMNLRLSRLEDDMTIVKTDIVGLKRDVGELKGDHLEDDVRAHPRAYLRKTHMIALRTLSDDEKYDLSHSLGKAEQDDLDEVDAVLFGRTVDGTEAYVAAEASVTLENKDLLRVLRRARLLATATGTPVLPVAVCRVEPNERILKKALELKVAIARKQGGVISDAPYIQPHAR